jgi:radical SAM superfamily enzyme YgiQ (UPF0313 family)
MESLSLATLAGLTPPDVEIRFFDERLEEVDFDAAADLVGISAETLNARRSYEIAAEFRRRGFQVVLGGLHPSLMPEEAGPYADALVIGQAEGVWGRVLEDAKRGRLRGIYRSKGPPVFGETIPNRTIHRGKRYLPVRLIEFGRGCVHRCDFCSVHNFFGQRYATRSIESLIAEIEPLEKQNLLFIDDNFFSDPARAAEVCRKLIPLKINWGCQASIGVADDEGLLDLLAASGCRGLLIGFESLQPENLRQMGKRFNGGVERYREAIRRIKARHITLYGSFVIGYDHETRESIRDAVDFAIAEKLTIATFYPLSPFPGTRLYARLKRQKRLRSEKWWLDPRVSYGDIFFHPKNMPAEELAELCTQARKRFYHPASVLYRALDFEANLQNATSLWYYLLTNVLINLDQGQKKKTRFGFEIPASDG